MAQESSTAVSRPPNWLDAHSDSSAGVHTFSQCMALADLNNDGDCRLVIADHGHNFTNMKLRVYRGTALVTENPLLDLPVALVSFHMDLTQPRVPAIAVASGPHIYIYKNLRPYFKFSLPPLEVSAVERDVWAQARDGDIEVEVLHEMLLGLSRVQGFSQLTSRSQHLVMLQDPEARRSFVEENKSQSLKKQTVLTCMTTLKKSMPDEDAVSCLVLGTESGHIYILDSEAFTILDTVRVGDIPALLAATGLRDVEFRVVACCRNKDVTLIKRGWRDAKPIIQLPSQGVALVMHPQGAIVLALMDNTLRGYTRKGKETWCISLTTSPRCMVGVPLPQYGTWAAAVGLANGQVLFYMDDQLVDVISNHSPVSAMVCGTFGRGEHCLIINTSDGSLLVKILRRTATFKALPVDSPAEATDQQLQIPKKTKLFVDHTLRERDNAKSIHQTFQHDLLRLRLRTARACAASLQGDSKPVDIGSEKPLRLSAQVRGLGPTFQLTVKLENMAENERAIGLAVVLHYDTKFYSVNKPFIQVPMIIPGFPFEITTIIKYVCPTPGLFGVVRVLVVQGGRAHQEPVLAATIQMPSPDPSDS